MHGFPFLKNVTVNKVTSGYFKGFFLDTTTKNTNLTSPDGQAFFFYYFFSQTWLNSPSNKRAEQKWNYNRFCVARLRRTERIKAASLLLSGQRANEGPLSALSQQFTLRRMKLAARRPLGVLGQRANIKQ